MKKRNLFAVFILPFVTFGIYGIVWVVKTKNEMNRLGANIPTAWLIIIPLVNIYWMWKYCEGVEQVTGGKLSGIMAFVLEMFLGVIANVIIQSEFNKIADVPITATTPSESSASPITQQIEPAVPSASFASEPSVQPVVASPIIEPVIQSGAMSEAPTDVVPAVAAPIETAMADIQQPSAPVVQPVGSTPGIISDVITQPSSTPEGVSPSQPTPTNQV